VLFGLTRCGFRQSAYLVLDLSSSCESKRRATIRAVPKHPPHLKIQRAKAFVMILAARFSLSARRVVSIGTSWKVERSAMNAGRGASIDANQNPDLEIKKRGETASLA
jgi:hypothetical protein